MAVAMTAIALPARADVRAGVTAWEAGDYARAVREWRPLAVAGDADAQFNLAQAYKLGRGLPVDLAEAAVWFRRAADQGHLQAQDNLGLVLYDMGQRAEALPLLQQSAERGEPRTQFVMGAELFNGERISRDLPRAYAYMKRAADAGLQRAAAALVQMDSAIPLEQRREGLSIAAAMEASEGQARLAAMTATAPPPRAVRPATIRATDIPASQAGTTYAPPAMAPAAAPAPAPAVTATATTAPATATAPATEVAPPGPAPAAVAVASAAPPRAPAAIGDEYPGLSASLGGTPAPAPAATARAATAAPQRTVPTPAVAQAPAPARNAPPAATAPSAAGAWRIQLGAFSNRARAETLWTSLSGRLPGATPSYLAAGAVTRLQAGPYASRAAAERACAAVRPAACFAVGR